MLIPLGIITTIVGLVMTFVGMDKEGCFEETPLICPKCGVEFYTNDGRRVYCKPCSYKMRGIY